MGVLMPSLSCALSISEDLRLRVVEDISKMNRGEYQIGSNELVQLETGTARTGIVGIEKAG